MMAAIMEAIWGYFGNTEDGHLIQTRRSQKTSRVEGISKLGPERQGVEGGQHGRRAC